MGKRVPLEKEFHDGESPWKREVHGKQCKIENSSMEKGVLWRSEFCGEKTRNEIRKYRGPLS